MINKNYEIKNLKNADLLDYLKLDPIYNANSIYVCKNKPEDTSLVAVSTLTKKVEATLITGLPDIFFVPGYWLSATNYESADAIINEIKDKHDFGINYPIWAEDVIRKYFNGNKFTCDNLYVYPQKELKPFDADKISAFSIAKKLTAELYEKSELHSELKELISLQDLIPDSKFYCAIENNIICAIGERLLDTGAAAGISQLMTVDNYRKKGYGSIIIYGLTKEILGENKIPFYLVSEENVASKKSCEKIGYVLYSRIGFAEIE